MEALNTIDDGYRISDAAIKGQELTDAMPPGLRACVHEYGFAVVHAFVVCGITEPRIIRHLVHTCWVGPRSPSETYRRKRTTRSVAQLLDWMLIQSGSSLSADGLLRALLQSQLVILPLEPSDLMVDASIAATAEMGLVSKREKHRGRLRAALRAAAVRMWPDLFAEAKR